MPQCVDGWYERMHVWIRINGGTSCISVDVSVWIGIYSHSSQSPPVAQRTI